MQREQKGSTAGSEAAGLSTFFQTFSTHLAFWLPPISASEPRFLCSPPMIPRSSSSSSSPRMLQVCKLVPADSARGGVGSCVPQIKGYPTPKRHKGKFFWWSFLLATLLLCVPYLSRRAHHTPPSSGEVVGLRCFHAAPTFSTCLPRHLLRAGVLSSEKDEQTLRDTRRSCVSRLLFARRHLACAVCRRVARAGWRPTTGGRPK